MKKKFNSPRYRFFYNVVGLELALHRPKIEGRENVPDEGCLIVSNHVSFMDPTTVGWAVGREIYFLGRKSLFKPPFWNWFLPLCNVLPIDRDGHDIAGMRRIIKMLQSGHSVLLFPEGTRSPDGRSRPAQPGAALIAVKANVPVLPARVFGTYESLSRHDKFIHFRPIRVVVGKPYRPTLPAGRLDRDAYDRVAQEMMAHIAELK
jgi:1-acyl-sn-glycerol-3-phosphate acyltransferase